MSHVLTLVAAFGTLTFGLTTFFSYSVYTRLQEDRKTTIELFFLRSEISYSLRTLLISILIFGVSGTVSLIGITAENIILAQALRLGSVTLFIGYMAFFLTLYLSTEPHSDFREIAPWLIDKE